MDSKISYKIAAFYRFVSIRDIASLRADILAFAQNHPSLCGTILLAPEGVNATIGAFPDALDAAVAFLDAHLGITQGELKYSAAESSPFNRFKVRPKKEIITLRKPDADPNIIVGDYVAAEDWNDLISDPEVTLIDTRNKYETAVGIFEGAVDPGIDVFSEFPDWAAKNLDPAKHKKVAMFCTGGIRCEKASSYMKAAGFENVYHLKGGILKYLETVSSYESLWRGECFVFDKRVSVMHGLRQGSMDLCHGCRAPLSQTEKTDAAYEPGVSCPHCIEGLTPERQASMRMRHRDYLKRRDTLRGRV